MAENITLNNIATFQNDTSAANTYNNNNTAIVNAFADVLSRSGVSPNQMSSTLDMNNNQIINLPAPTTASSPMRLIDANGAITINTATTGTSGHTVPFLDGANTWSAVQTISVNGASANGLNVNVGATGSSGVSTQLNEVNITDTMSVTGSNFLTGLFVNHAFGTSTAQGGRQALFGLATQISTTSASSSNRNYVGVVGGSVAGANDNGSGLTSGTAQGAFIGSNFFANASTGATNLLNVSGAEFNTSMSTGSSVWAKSLAQFSGTTVDTVAGTGINTMLWLYNQSGAVKWTNGILIDNAGGTGIFPIATTGTIIKTSGNGTVTNGIDFTNTTFSGTSFASPGFSVNPVGAVNTGAGGIGNGGINFVGSTSGFVTAVTNSTGNLLTITQPTQIGVSGATAGALTIAGQTSGVATLTASATGGTLQLGLNNLTIDTSGNLATSGAVKVGQSTAVTAGGDTGHPYLYGTLSNFGIYFGSGVPTITAAQGSLYIRSDGSSGTTRAYINTTGSNVWTAINTVT